MKTIHNKKVADLLNSWLDKNHTSIKKAAEKLNVAQTALWRQLKGIDPIPLNRLQEMIGLWAPSDIEMEKMNVLLSGEEEQPDVSEQAEEQADEQEEEITAERKPGEIVYYGTWGSICRGIFCGLNLDGSRSIVFQTFPKPAVMSPDNGKHEYYICEEIHPDDLFSTPEALMDRETAEIRAEMERQIATMNQDA